MTVHPHRKDWFADHRFSPQALAPSDGGAWVADSFLAVLAWVDLESGSVFGPFPVDRGDATGASIEALLAAEGAVWVGFNGTVTRFDPLTKKSTSVLPTGRTWELAAGEGAVWTFLENGAVGRIDPSGLEVDDLGTPWCGGKIEVGHGSVWTLGWTGPSNEQSLLSRWDPRSGACQAELELDGMLGPLTVDSSDVSVDVSRRTRAEPTNHLLRIDPGSMQITAETEFFQGTGGLTLKNGVLWKLSASVTGLPWSMNRFDAATGELLGSTVLDGPVSQLVAGESHVWGCPASPTPSVIAFDSNGEHHTVISVADVDIAPHRPPPPPPIEADRTEAETREYVSRILASGFIPEITVTDVRLDGSFPDTEVLIYFRSDEHPGILFLRQRRIWEDSGALSFDALIISSNLKEDIVACGHGLPANPTKGPDGLTRFVSRQGIRTVWRVGSGVIGSLDGGAVGSAR